MTKGGGFPFGSSGDDVAHCHLRIVDDDALHEPCDQVAALDKRYVVQSRLGASAQCLDALRHTGHSDVLRGLGLALAPWLRQTVVGLRSLLSFALALCTLAHLRQVSIAPPRLWTVERREASAPRWSMRWQGLGAPGAPRRPFKPTFKGGYKLEVNFGEKCQKWVAARYSVEHLEHYGCNIFVFIGTFLSIT